MAKAIQLIGLFLIMSSLLQASPDSLLQEDHTQSTRLLHCHFEARNIKFIRADSYCDHLLAYDLSVNGQRLQVPFRVKLMAHLPTHADVYLANWLHYSDWNAPRAEHHYRTIQKQTLKTAEEQKMEYLLQSAVNAPTDAFMKGGTLVHGKEWSLLLGFSLTNTEGFQALSQEQQMLVASKLKQQLLPDLIQMAKSVQWFPEKRQDSTGQAKLVQKGSYYYKFESRDSVNIVSDMFIQWYFENNGKFRLLCNNYFGEYRLANNGQRKSGIINTSGHYKVIRDQNNLIIIARTEKGDSFVRQVEFGKKGTIGISKDFTGLAIQGRIEGQYSLFNGQMHRL